MSPLRLRTAIVAGGAALMAVAAIATPVAAGPSPPLGAPPVYVQVVDAADVDPDPSLLDVGVFRYQLDETTERFNGEIGVIRVAPAGGRAHRIGRFGYEQAGGGSEHSVDPCTIGGKDLPNERFTVTVEFADVSPPNGFTAELRLGPDTTKPKVKKIQSSPDPGSEVKKGETISFEVVAKEDIPGATWQTGVQTLQVIGPRGVIKDESAGRRPKACKGKSESLTITGKYKVKGSDPAVIEICGIAQDYATNEDSTCAQYYKGEVWEGRYRTRDPTCPFTWEGPVQVVVAPNGSVTGGGTGVVTEGHLGTGYCDTAEPGQGEAPIEISGKRKGGRFELSVLPGPVALNLDVTGKNAKGSTEVFDFTSTMNLACKTCDE